MQKSRTPQPATHLGQIIPDRQNANWNCKCEQTAGERRRDVRVRSKLYATVPVDRVFGVYVGRVVIRKLEPLSASFVVRP